ncbi:MAG: hypothetical protein ABEH56_07195, partial [Salinirussus sp.]
PTVEVRVTQAFREVRADQRRAICELLATLARGCDVRLVATGFMQRWLAREHRTDLPGVSEQCSTGPTRPGRIDELVEAARDALALESREVAILRALTDDPAETLPYTALYAEHDDVTEHRVRQCVSRLTNLGLIDTFPDTGPKHAELLAAGREFIDAIDRDIGRQRRLDECVSDTGKSSPQAVYARASPEAPSGAAGAAAVEAATGAPERDDDDQPPAAADGAAAEAGPPYRTRYLDRAGHAAAAACCRSGGLTLVDHHGFDAESADEWRIRWVSYDSDRDEGVIAVRATGPFQYLVSTAVALASPRFFDEALPVDRLEAIDDPPAILRDARCIGSLPEEAEDDPQVLRDGLVEWGETIERLTTTLQHDECEDRDALRSEIMRSAHGLAGSIAHLLDVAGVDLVREVRVPGGLDRGKLEELARSIGMSAAIQARYGGFATYRQLFEDREQKREAALVPEVDAADPLGALIGGFVVRGPDLHRLEPFLPSALRSPAAVHEDAPEIAVPVTVASGVQRSAYADVVRRLCAAKNMDATRDAVSLLQAFAGSPHDVARALQGLGSEDRRREIHPDEVRLALSTLPADRILPDAAPTVSKAVHALLTAAEPLTQAELADRAGISARSLRTHADRLSAFGFVEATEAGYRLALPFRDERSADREREDALPWYVKPNRERDDYRDATEKGVLAEVVYRHDFEGAAGVAKAMRSIETLQLPPDVRREVVEIWPWAGPLLDAVRAIAAEEVIAAEEFTLRHTGLRTVTFGAEIKQTSLSASLLTRDATPTGPVEDRVTETDRESVRGA